MTSRNLFQNDDDVLPGYYLRLADIVVVLWIVCFSECFRTFVFLQTSVLSTSFRRCV